MNAKVLMLMWILNLIMIGTSFGKPIGLPWEVFGDANAIAEGHGAVINGQAIGTGTGIANAEPGGFAISLGIGIAVDTPLGPLTLGHGQSVSVGK